MIRSAALRRGLRRFGEDRRGVSAIEFAMVAPLMLLILFGLNELGQAMMAQRKVSHAASQVGDLAAQSKSLTKAEVDQIFGAGTATVVPFDTALLKLRLTSITADANNLPKIDWTRSQGMDKRTIVPTDLPAGLVVTKGDSVILAEATYLYSSPFSFQLANYKPIGPVQLNEHFYLRPRQSNIACSDCD